MAKAYWVATYRSISDPDALAGYAKLAGPAIQAAGGRFLARGTAAKAYEAGVVQRVVIIEFDNVEKAEAAHGQHRATQLPAACQMFTESNFAFVVVRHGQSSSTIKPAGGR